MATSSCVLNLSASKYDILNSEASTRIAPSFATSETCQKLGSCSQLELGRGDGVSYPSYSLLAYKGGRKSSFPQLKINQATGHRSLLPAQRLVHPTCNSVCFFLRAVFLWILCLIFCTVSFWVVSLTFLMCTCFSSCTTVSSLVAGRGCSESCSGPGWISDLPALLPSFLP